MTSVGQPIDRVDARAKVTGAATYAAEVEVAAVAHAVIVCSPGATGTLRALDVAAARAHAGVLAVITHENVPRVDEAPRGHGPGDRVLQLLQGTDIHYADQPVAVVVASTLEAAQHAAARVVARVEGAAPAAALGDAIGDAYKPPRAGPSGDADSSRGDLTRGLAAARWTVDATYTTPVENHNPMEPHATIASWPDREHLTLYDATQGIFGVRARLAQVFGLEPANVRVIDRYVGGGFGCKGTPWSHVVLAALAAKVVGRPVKLVVTRMQMFSLVGHRPETRQRVTLGADAQGRLTAMRHEVVSETSRFDQFVEPAAVQTRMLYACDHVATSHRLVRLDVPTPTFQRAPGEATGTFALESAMDELAWASGIDPVALRLRNHADRDPHENKPWSSKSLRECYRVGAERFRWPARLPPPGSMRDGRERVGWGMATATYPARQIGSSARARLREDGTVQVQAGTQDIGTGTYTVMTQIAADALGVPVASVQFELGDTSLPETPVSGGSMTASSTGSAVKMACEALRTELLGLAINDPRSALSGLRADALDAADGALFARDEPSRRDTYQAIRARAGRDVVAERHTDPKSERARYSSHSFGADFVEVRVDESLGAVRVSRVVAAFAAGTILNPKTANSQFVGGIIWALGMALHERTARDPRTARVMTRDLADYHVPVNADVPPIDVIVVPERDPFVNEVGAKGIGEIGITGCAAAIANAVYHATGRRVRDLPITLDKLL